LVDLFFPSPSLFFHVLSPTARYCSYPLSFRDELVEVVVNPNHQPLLSRSSNFFFFCFNRVQDFSFSARDSTGTVSHPFSRGACFFPFQHFLLLFCNKGSPFRVYGSSRSPSIRHRFIPPNSPFYDSTNPVRRFYLSSSCLPPLFIIYLYPF